MTIDVPASLAEALSDRYRIERALGAGGMATVYLAEDLKHDRKVAVKVLKPELAAVLGAERFVVEIKTTAALQHPHILPLFDSGTAGGFLFYVMPYIQGETIREKLNRETQFGVEEAVRITREVADALDYAHRSGVIHRDIKPENLLLHDGRAMVMDFGIALAVSAAAGGRMTETGLSLGTPHYMSPEQATAEKDLSPRSDVYSLASVLYEMLTGNPPHVGASAQQIIMKIITTPAEPVTVHRKSVPPHVAAALARALEKLPADRFETAKAFRDALAMETYTYGTAALAGAADSARDAAAARGGRRASALAWGLAAVAVIAAAAGWMRRAPEEPARRFDLVLGAVTMAPNREVVISPDGSMLAVAGTVGSEEAIYLRHLDGDPEFRKLAGTESGYAPSFSPDNQWIVFRKASDRSLVKISVGGGGAVKLVGGGAVDPFTPHWGTNDQIVFAGPTGVFRVSVTGGDPVPIPKVTARLPFLLPDGSGVLYSFGNVVLLHDFKSDSSIALMSGGRSPVYVPTGHILYNSEDGGLFAVAFDLPRHRVQGAPVRVLERAGAQTSTRGYSVSATGVLVQYDAPGSAGGGTNRLVIVDPGHGADTVRLPSARRNFPRFSRDGRSIAMEVAAIGRGSQTDIYTVNLVTGTYTQLTFEGDNDEPVWSPDGKHILFDKFLNTGEELYIKPADNSGPERRLTTLKAAEIQAQQWVDDKTLLFNAMTPNRAYDVFTMGADSGSVPVPYLQSPFSEAEPWLSSDKKLMAFTSNETGGDQIWMRDFPVPQGKWNISRGPGVAARWSPDGKYVYFWRPAGQVDTLFRARIERTPTVVVQAPEVVSVLDADGVVNWDLHPDGRRFVVAMAARAPADTSAAAPRSRYLIVQNWFSELRRLTTAKGK